MNCKKLKTNLSAYLDDSIQQYDKELLEKHLLSCAKCAKEYNELKNIKQLLSVLDKQHPHTDFENKVIDRIKNNNSAINLLESFVVAAQTTLAAAVLLFGIIATFSFFTPSMPAGSNIDNVEKINNYVLKGNTFAKRGNISEAKIIEALLR